MENQEPSVVNGDLSKSNMPIIKTTKVVYPQLYSYTLPDIEQNQGSQKIGYTERKDVDARIREQVRTAGFQVRSEKLWSAPAFFSNSTKDFKDKLFHKFLIKSGVENRTNLGTEWFFFNGTPERSKQLFDAFRENGFAALQSNDQKMPYSLRAEQQDAVAKAREYFNNKEGGEFLWNAKPRFGKTLASYDLAKQLGAKKVLIVTNRPAIANSWFDDFNTFIDGYLFISDTTTLADRPSLTRQQYVEIGINEGVEKPQITFLSLQDLKGSKYFGGSHDKLKWVADLDWDLLVIDEAHEGVDTSRTDAAFTNVSRKHTLHLSGTPFKALASNKFPKEAIYNWTYLDEQKVKQAELDEDEIGEHTDLPDLKLFTYRISQMVADEVNEGVEIDDIARDYAFDLNEFFSTSNQKFTHEADVKEFLKNLTTNAKYPFSTPELRDELRHTFWYVGNRVESVKALEQLLNADPVFKDYKVVVAAGDGKSFSEEDSDFKGNEKSFDKVKKAISENPKTITLSCGQLTTGVTIKEWSAVLMLTDIKTPSLYMQAAFRAQNPYRFEENGEIKAKQSAYLFDFAPTRVLEIYDQFANALNPKAVNGEITESERKDNIKELLNFFPVISEDVNGKMVELDAEKVLTFPNALAATEIVKARFMTNLLFNDNIKGVFSFPKEVEDILGKMSIEKNKRVETAKKELDLDDARKKQEEKSTKINENSNVILGSKIYRANIDRVVDNALNYETPDETLATLPQQVMNLAEPVIAKYKEVYKANASELDEKRKQIEETTKQIVAEYESSEFKDPSALKDSLVKIIEQDFVETTVEQKETEVINKIQKTKEEEVRDRLRSFTRTIPMFIMANSSKGEITIDNFDENINDDDFVDLTNITKEEFHKLRDGFDYELDGERKTFGGVFDKYRFNASIAEFVAEKEKRANYFITDEDIFELIPNQKNNQIFTPKEVVRMTIDGLESHEPDLFHRTDSTFIDLYMKSGLYITEIVKKLFTNTRHNYTSDKECIRHILENQVYGLSPTDILQGITHSFIFGFDENNEISDKNFIKHDLLPEAKLGTAKQKILQLFNKGGDMKFDAVVGNPPYQEETQDNNRDKPIYHLFMNEAYKLSSKAILISPARFLFDIGQTPKEWNEKMLKDKHLKVIYYEQDSSKVFANTDIKGGVAITYRDNDQDFGAIDTFISREELRTIREKVLSNDFVSLNSIHHGRSSYKLNTKLYTDNPSLKGRIKASEEKSIGSNIFDKLPEVFMDEPNDSEHLFAKVLGRQENKRAVKWLKKEYLMAHENFGKWKVFVAKSNGGGELGALSNPILGEEFTLGTQTYISFGAFDHKLSSENLIKYLKTKFSRAMLGIKKITQDNATKEVWKYVPLQDFTNNSDIDWQASIKDIDQQLYKKYNLNEQEISFIELNVKSMEK